MRVPPAPYRLRFEAMASRCEIVLVDAPLPQAQAAARLAMAEVRRIEAKYSRYLPNSVVSHINANAGNGKSVTIDDETSALFDYADHLHALSGGLFDLSSGPLRRAWDFRQGRVPSDEALATQLSLIGWALVERQAKRVTLPRSGMELDLGGIGKEYAADRAHAVLADAGLACGFVNLGGDLRVLGPQADGRPWCFGIQHPRQGDAICANVQLVQGALATSGDYERYFVTPEGRRCCHILDPRSGQPASHWQSVSVIAPLCSAAGALATIAMLSGPGAVEFLRAQGAASLCIDANGISQLEDIDSVFIKPTPSSYVTTITP